VPHYNGEERSPVPYHLMNDMKTSNSISPTNSNRNSAASSDSGRGYSTGQGEPRVGTDSGRDHIGGVMVSMLASSVVDRGFESWAGQTKDYKIGICCFSTNHATLRRKSKDWLARYQNNVSELSDMSTHPQTVVSVS
jgi:hypothetical protein